MVYSFIHIDYDGRIVFYGMVFYPGDFIGSTFGITIIKKKTKETKETDYVFWQVVSNVFLQFKIGSLLGIDTTAVNLLSMVIFMLE